MAVLRPCLLFATLALLLQPAFAAIDCSRATSNADRLVCSNTTLALAEQKMAFAFRQAIRRGVSPSELRRTQLDWKNEVRDLCNDVPCMLRAYEDRAADLDNLGR